MYMRREQRAFKKRFLSLILVIALSISLLPENLQAAIVKEYNLNYGEQIVDDYSGLSKYIYDRLVDSYIYKNGDRGNIDNKYTGLPRPISERELKVEGEKELPIEVVTDQEIREKYIGQAFNDGYSAFVKDYPQVFWIGQESGIIGRFEWRESAHTYAFKMEITLQEYEDGAIDGIRDFNDGILKAKANIESGFKSGTTIDKKVKAIHDYIANNVDYNHDAAESLGYGDIDQYGYAFSAYPVFVKEKGKDRVVCEGYAKSLKILCDRFNIQAAIIIGKGVNQQGGQENHMWNAVAINGKWYGVDATWDDQTETIEEVMDTYLLVGTDSKGFHKNQTYGTDHIAENLFSTNVGAKQYVLPKVEQKGFYEKTDEENKPSVEETTTKPEETTTKPADKPSVEETTTKPEDTTTKPADKPSGGETTKPSGNGQNNVKNYTWKISGITDKKTYTGRVIKQNITITCDKRVLVEGKDYRISYKNNINAGKATIMIIPMGEFDGMKAASTTFTIKKASISKVSVKKIKTQKYKKGKAVKPKVTVKFGGKKLKSGKDYKVTYKNNKKKGTGKVIIKGKGNFTGKKTIKFKIK